MGKEISQSSDIDDRGIVWGKDGRNATGVGDVQEGGTRGKGEGGTGEAFVVGLRKSVQELPNNHNAGELLILVSLEVWFVCGSYGKIVVGYVKPAIA